VIKRLKNNLIYALVLFLIGTVRRMPRPLAMGFLAKLARIGFFLAASERRKTERNLRFIYGGQWDEEKIQRTASAVFENLGRNLADVILFRRFGPERFFAEHSVCNGWENLVVAHKRGKGVVCLASHRGAFELLQHYLAFRGYPVCVVGSPLYDPRINRLVVSNRIGERIHYVERGNAPAREIVRFLRRGDLFGVLLDQDTKVKGVFAPFLGKPAFTPSTPVVLAMKTGAAIVPFAIELSSDRKQIITVEPEIKLADTGDFDRDLVENVTRCNAVISNWINALPEQWVWMHERWKTKKL
jgi:KDO2-lipid IV(A) lauroyltransferase